MLRHHVVVPEEGGGEKKKEGEGNQFGLFGDAPLDHAPPRPGERKKEGGKAFLSLLISRIVRTLCALKKKEEK